jgi:hypothetical protein
VPADEISLARVTSQLPGTQDPRGVDRSPGAGGPARLPVVPVVPGAVRVAADRGLRRLADILAETGVTL